MNNNQDSFFSSIQNLVISGLRKLPNEKKNKNKQSPLGRYLAICLREVLQENKKLLNKLFGVSHISEIKLEYYYTQDRRADMALLDRYGQVSILIEIKVEDKLRPGQLESYINYCKKNKTKFFLLTRWLPNEKENNLIKNNGAIITLSEVHQRIESSMHHYKHPISKMFCKFLKESKMDYEQKISDDLSFLAQKIFFSSKKDNRVTIDKLIYGVPNSISTIFADLEIITRDLMERLKINNRKLSLNMWFNPLCDGDKLNNLIRNGEFDEEGNFIEDENFDENEKYNLKDEKMIDSGLIWFSSIINLGNSKSFYCTLGFG